MSLALATANDVSTLLPLMRELQRDDPFETPYDELKSKRALSELLSTAAMGRVWKIEVDTTTAGYVAATTLFSLELGGRCWLIDELFVDASHRGRGVGKAALSQVAELARHESIRSILLEVSRDNERAKRLYTSLGFRDRSYHLMKLDLP